MTNIEAALQLVEQGVAVYPADVDTKRPLIHAWNHSGAIRDEERLARVFREHPGAAIGIATKPSRLVVLDVDPRNGGDKSFDRLCRDIDLLSFDCAPIVRTPSGGMHVYFAATEILRGGSNALGKGLDVITTGGVIAPPSRRSTGAQYRWHTPDGALPDSFEPPPLPSVLTQRLKAKAAARVGRELRNQLSESIERGRRNATLASLAGRIHWNFGFSGDLLASILQSINTAICRPPLEACEVQTIAASVSGYGIGVEPMAWLEAWLPQLSGNELQVAFVLARIAESLAGELTPAAEAVCARASLRTEKYYAARKRMKELRAIDVRSRGPLTPEIRLLMPPGVTSAKSAPI